MAGVGTQQVVSEEAYFSAAEASVEKLELHHGQIVAMAGGSATHAAIAANAIAALARSLPQGCRVYGSDLRIGSEAGGTYIYPDVTIVCGSLRFWPGRADTIVNPTVVMEVLSPATMRNDTTAKLDFTLSLASVQQVFHIFPDQLRVECFRRTDVGWLFESFVGDAAQLTIAGAEVSLTDLYRDLPQS